MNRILPALLLGCLCVLNAHGQATVTVTGRVLDGETGLPVSTGYGVEILYAPGITTDDGIFTRVGAIQTFLAPNGTFSGAGRTITGAGPGPHSFYAGAWQLAFGNSYQQASTVPGAKAGRSVYVVANLDPGSMQPTPINFGDIRVYTVPEPATIAFFALLAVPLFLCRVESRGSRHR